MGEFEDRLVLVIGGSSGIGRELAMGFAREGARVAIVGRDPAKLDAAAAVVGAEGAKPATYSADMRSLDDLRDVQTRLAEKHGVPDVLVNCQGTTVIKPALDVSEAEYDTVVDTNLKSVYFACTTFAAGMVERGSGAIVNIASLAAHNGWKNASAYAASKWAVVGITQSFAAEWGAAGVRVNAIAPGFFMTDLNREKMPPERKEEAVRRCAMGRMGELPELVGAAIFLASDGARFVNGATLRVDGGYLASGI